MKPRLEVKGSSFSFWLLLLFYWKFNHFIASGKREYNLNIYIYIFFFCTFIVFFFYAFNNNSELQRIESITSSPIISHFSETILGLTTIRAYNQESRFMETLFKHMEANNVAFIILNSSNRWLGIALVSI